MSHSFLYTLFSRACTLLLGAHSIFRIHGANSGLKRPFIKSFFRNVIVIRARARLSVLVRYCAAVFSKKKKPKEITNDTDSFVVVRNTHTHTHILQVKSPGLDRTEVVNTRNDLVIHRGSTTNFPWQSTEGTVHFPSVVVQTQFDAHCIMFSNFTVRGRIVKITPSSHPGDLPHLSATENTSTTSTSCDQPAHILSRANSAAWRNDCFPQLHTPTSLVSHLGTTTGTSNTDSDILRQDCQRTHAESSPATAATDANWRQQSRHMLQILSKLDL